VGTLTLDGTDLNAQYFNAGNNGIEQCQANPRDGKFWLVVPKAANGYGAVLRISAKEPFQVEEIFYIKTAGCVDSPPPSTATARPAGLAIGPDHQMLVGCNGSATTSLIIDDRSLPPDPTVIAYVTTSSGVDEVWFDPGSNHYYLAQSAPTPPIAPVMGVEDAGHGKLPHPDPDASIPTGSKNPAADPDRNLVYLPVLAVAAPGTSICGSYSQQGCIAIYSAPLDGDDRGGGDNDRN
jgi:hypothetical protein